MTPVIKVENLSKQYRLGQIGGGTLSGDLSRWWARFRGNPDPSLRIGQEDLGDHRGETIWALRDVSFEVEQGEVLGIIGKNGAGKSTLLKILSRITAPTSGTARLKGRVGSLLEVGTGFHPELTGRENIYLNGAILGMTRDEVTRKFAEIVDFAGIEQFIDTPVKRYSSGMYVRLAFAVAAHLDPEILLVDEVLAVGDAEFQKKCLGKMGDVAQEGRTVLFVSHNMNSIEHLCNKSLLLVQGKILLLNSTQKTIEYYLEKNKDRSAVYSAPLATISKKFKKAFYRNIRILSIQGVPTNSITMNQAIKIELNFEVCQPPLVNPSFGIEIQGPTGQPISRIITKETYGTLPNSKTGGKIYLSIEKLNLLPGIYYITAGISESGQQIETIPNAIKFEILYANIYSTGKLPPSHSGYVYFLCNWDFDYT